MEKCCTTAVLPSADGLRRPGVGVTPPPGEADLAAEACRLARVGGWCLSRRDSRMQTSRLCRAVLGLGSDASASRWTELLACFALRERQRVEAAVAQAWGSGQEFDLELPLDAVRGGGRWVRLRGGPARDDRLFGSVQDISPRKQAQIALEQAREATEWAMQEKTRFLAAASHDLRQPLAAMKLYLGTLARRTAGAHARLIADMNACVGGLSDLIASLLDLSVLQSGTPRVQPDDFAVDGLLERLICAHRPEAEGKRLQLRFRPARLAAHTDPVLFARIVGNFITNAVRYTARGGVLIACRMHDGRHWVEVWDTGPGIPRAHHTTIFEEFVRLPAGAEVASGGCGLGLAIAARTARLLGLHIRLRSHPGRGAMFAVELPPGRCPPGSEALCATTSRSLRILLIDANTPMRRALAGALEEEGHKVLVLRDAADLENSPATAGDATPELLLLDAPLGAAAGTIALLGVLRQRFGTMLPAVALSADTSAAHARDLAEAGLPLIYKPVNLAALLQLAGRLTERRGDGVALPD